MIDADKENKSSGRYQNVQRDPRAIKQQQIGNSSDARTGIVPEQKLPDWSSLFETYNIIMYKVRAMNKGARCLPPCVLLVTVFFPFIITMFRN